MPTVLRRSGPDILIRKGADFERHTPRAMIHFCETCGFEGAAFGVHADGKLLSYCGWQNGAPVCVGKGRRGEAA